MFDKGFYITVPLDSFFLGSTRKKASIAFCPLTRDGGPRVYVSRRLLEETEEADLGLLGHGWPNLLN